MITVSGTIDHTQRAFERAKAGEPAPEWCDCTPTRHDGSVAPPGKYALSVFAQHAPYTLASGEWHSRREQIGGQVVARIARLAPDLPEVIEERQVLGPPDIEAPSA
jgi:phytoene dehydrogenase-like protein